MTSRARRRTAAVVALLAPLLAACTPTPAPPDLDELCESDVVVRCTDGEVVVALDAADDDVLSLASDLHAAAASEETRVVLSRDGALPARWSLQVFPADEAEMTADLEGMLRAESMPELVSYSVIDGWPYVTIEDIERFGGVFDELSARPEFADGATYTLLSGAERLRIVHVPSRTTAEAVHGIIDIARRLPDAEVLLEAPTAGPQWPTLYVSRLSPEQVETLAAELRDPSWAGADVDGLPVEFVLGTVGPDGTTYTTGTLGDVPQ